MLQFKIPSNGLTYNTDVEFNCFDNLLKRGTPLHLNSGGLDQSP
jgi:hypothetical protein